MRNTYGLALAIALSSATAFAASAPGTGVVGSVHDMNQISTSFGGSLDKDPQGRVCAFCHTPHHALADETNTNQYLPLWSHQLTDIAGWTSYTSPTLDAAAAGDPLIGPSRLCMSCHDGVIAADQHYNLNNGASGHFTPGLTSDDWNGRAIGKNKNLGNDHPVGINYYESVANDKKQQIKPATSAFYNNPANLKINQVLWNDDGSTVGFLTCASCHDVHNKANATQEIAGTPNYLVYSPQNKSKLCLSCHDKGNPADGTY